MSPIFIFITPELILSRLWF